MARLDNPDVVVVGGGVIGLATAWRLAQHGLSVTVLDAGHAGQASRAAAGMLAPLAEAHAPSAFVQIGLDSLHRYPDFVGQLREQTGQELAPLGPGMLRLARTDAEEDRLCRALAWQHSLGLPLERLDSGAVHRLEPALSEDVRAAILSPREQHLPPRRLLVALRTACKRFGVNVWRGAPVTGMDWTSGRITSVRTADRPYSGRQIVITSGAWSAELCRMLGLPLPVAPLRGQALSLGPVSPLPFTHTLYGSEGYLVPRPNGHIVVGATEEHAGFDARTTREGVSSLRRMGERLVPALIGMRRADAWAGLRPVSVDGLPTLGQVPGVENAFLAVGHGRNGILLAPETAEIMARLLGDSVSAPAAFRPERFAETS